MFVQGGWVVAGEGCCPHSAPSPCVSLNGGSEGGEVGRGGVGEDCFGQVGTAVEVGGRDLAPPLAFHVATAFPSII